MTEQKKIIVAVPNGDGSYKSAKGTKVNLFAFDPDTNVRTKQMKYVGTTIDELVSAGEFERLETEMSIPKDTPFYKELTNDARFSTIESLLENEDQLKDIKGIGPLRKEEIINHVTNSQ